jgi:hypothetical protein
VKMECEWDGDVMLLDVRQGLVRMRCLGPVDGRRDSQNTIDACAL